MSRIEGTLGGYNIHNYHKEKIMTQHKVPYLHGVKQIVQWKTSRNPTKVKPQIMFISTLFVSTCPKTHFSKVKRLYLPRKKSKVIMLKTLYTILVQIIVFFENLIDTIKYKGGRYILTRRRRSGPKPQR